MLDRFDPARLRPAVIVALLVGLVAGLTSALLLSVTGEPLVRAAIAIERARDAATGHGGADPELVSRSVQSGPGLFAALGLSGAVFGVLFALAFWGLRHAQPEPFRRSLWAGAILFGSLTLAPWVKYPPNPPAVGDPATLGRRQALYVSLIALSLALSLLGAALAGRLHRDGWPEHRRVPAVAAAVALAFGLALALLPPAPDPVDAPATLVWRFRLASLGGNAVLWGVLTVGFGLLAAEAARRRSRSLVAVSV
ncbi:MAG: CbtA family protein [Acidimicrobiales bacterium]